MTIPDSLEAKNCRDFGNNVEESDEKYAAKKSRIKSLLQQKDATVLRTSTQKCCRSCGGLIDNETREKLWPFLITGDMGSHEMKENYEPLSKTQIEEHKDYYQVYVDVSRALKRFPPSIQSEGSVVDKYMDDLIEVILKILDTDSDLHYYQGFHDVLVTFLMVLGKETTFSVAIQLVQTHLKTFMTKTMKETNDLLFYMYAVFEEEDKKLFDHLMSAELGTIFALPWVITWFSHTLNDLSLVLRLFDLFVASDPLLPVYLSAAFVLHMREAVLDCECEMPMIHKMLGDSINDPSVPWDKLIDSALDLMDKYPAGAISKRAKLIQDISAPKPRTKPNSGGNEWSLMRYQSVLGFISTFVRQRPMFTFAIISSVIIAYFFNSYRTRLESIT